MGTVQHMHGMAQFSGSSSMLLSEVHFEKPDLRDGDGWLWRETEECRICEEEREALHGIHQVLMPTPAVFL